MGQGMWNQWLGVITFTINANINHTTDLTPFYLMLGREPMIPLYTIVGLPQPEALEPQDYAWTRALAMARHLTFTEENYNVYYKRTEATYKAKSPIGDPQHLHKLVWAWSLYRKLGTSGALLAKWSGPWKIVKFSPSALLVIQTTWLKITSRKEVCRKIVINKLKPFLQTPDHIRYCQIEAYKVLEENLDEEAVEPYMDPEDSRARLGYIQCMDVALCPADLGEVTIHKEKDGDWGGKLPTPNPGMDRPTISEEGHSNTPPAPFNSGSTASARETLEEGQDETAPRSPDPETTETAKTGPREDNRETLVPGPDKNRPPGAHDRRDKDSGESRVEKSTKQAGRDQSEGPRGLEQVKEPSETKELVKFTLWTAEREAEQSKRKGGGPSKGTIQKLGSKMKELWKTMTPDEKGGAPAGGKNPKVTGIHQGDNDGPPA